MEFGKDRALWRNDTFPRNDVLCSCYSIFHHSFVGISKPKNEHEKKTVLHSEGEKIKKKLSFIFPRMKFNMDKSIGTRTMLRGSIEELRNDISENLSRIRLIYVHVCVYYLIKHVFLLFFSFLIVYTQHILYYFFNNTFRILDVISLSTPTIIMQYVFYPAVTRRCTITN